jgi:hypothetical protein
MWCHTRTLRNAVSILFVSALIVAGTPWPAASADGSPGAPLLSPQRVAALKCTVAACTAALLVWGIALRRAGRAGASVRLRNALLLTLGVLGALGWWNFLQFRYGPGYGHPMEIYHYYIGSKYFDELGYTRLYECTTVADAESGFRDLAARRFIRNLESYEIVRAGYALLDPTRCTRHFSLERWERFKYDVGWFRERVPEPVWQGALVDHGYNGSPAWGALGKVLIGAKPASHLSLLPLVLIDPVLLIVMWAFVWRAFGWRATCIALVFWGTNQPGDFLWTGGSFLRQGWLATMVVGICCLRMKWMGAGGFLLAVAALLRVFPVLAIFAIVVSAGLAMGRARRFQLSPVHRRFALGVAAAAVILVPLSFAVAGGPRAWTDFAENIRLHADSPIVNDVGLKMLLSYEHATRLEQIEKISANPALTWMKARRATLERRRILFASAIVGYLVLLAGAIDRKADWVAAILGAGAVVVMTTMSNYYYGVLLGFGFLWAERESIGAALCGLSALTWAIDWTWPYYDETYTWVSLATVAFVVAVTGLMAWQGKAVSTSDAANTGAPRRGSTVARQR